MQPWRLCTRLSGRTWSSATVLSKVPPAACMPNDTRHPERMSLRSVFGRYAARQGLAQHKTSQHAHDRHKGQRSKLLASACSNVKLEWTYCCPDAWAPNRSLAAKSTFSKKRFRATPRS